MNQLTNPEAFQKWLSSPLTQAFRQYLKDYRDRIALAWAEGNPLGVKEQSQAETMGDLAALECNNIREFYGLEEANEQQ